MTRQLRTFTLITVVRDPLCKVGAYVFQLAQRLLSTGSTDKIFPIDQQLLKARRCNLEVDLREVKARSIGSRPSVDGELNASFIVPTVICSFQLLMLGIFATSRPTSPRWLLGADGPTPSMTVSSTLGSAGALKAAPPDAVSVDGCVASG